MEELEESTKYVPDYVMIERIKKQEAAIRKEAVKVAKEKGERIEIKKEKIEMAKNSLKEGLSIELIIKLTGLTKAEIDIL